MSCVSRTPPLGHPRDYHPSFKVDTCLGEPLWDNPSSSQWRLPLEILSVCSHLDLLSFKHFKHSGSKHKHRSCTQQKGTYLLSKMQDELSGISSVYHYLQSTEIAELYPRAATACRKWPPVSDEELESSEMDSYFSWLATLNQVYTLSQQIHTDILTQANHKYIAHQLAQLYQVLHTVQEVEIFQPYKEDIESKFKAIKFALSPPENDEGNKEVKLPDVYAKWLLELTHDVAELVSSMPDELVEYIQTAVDVVARL